jgi:hypothetical protein
MEELRADVYREVLAADLHVNALHVAADGASRFKERHVALVRVEEPRERHARHAAADDDDAMVLYVAGLARPGEGGYAGESTQQITAGLEHRCGPSIETIHDRRVSSREVAATIPLIAIARMGRLSGRVSHPT